MPLKELDSEGLRAIRDADAAVGPDDELGFFPPTTTHRRQLLRRLDATDEVLADHRRLVRELDVLLNGEDGAAQQASLCDIVGQLRYMKARATLVGPDGPVMELGEGVLCDFKLCCDGSGCEVCS